MSSPVFDDLIDALSRSKLSHDRRRQMTIVKGRGVIGTQTEPDCSQ